MSKDLRETHYPSDWQDVEWIRVEDATISGGVIVTTDRDAFLSRYTVADGMVVIQGSVPTEPMADMQVDSDLFWQGTANVLKALKGDASQGGGKE